MNTSLHPLRHAHLRAALFVACALLANVGAQESLTAQSLAARLSANVLDGSSAVRMKMDIQRPSGGAKTALQLQVKSRRTKAGTDVIYSVLWPKERKGESFLVRKAEDRAASGSVFVPPDTMRPISSSQMRDAVFGSDLSYEDLVSNFFAWDQQAFVGTETVDRVPCQILESKPGGGDRSGYSKVRSWIDLKRMVPLRVEKYSSSGQLARRIDTTRVAKDDRDRPVPASLDIRRPGQDSITEIEGSNIRHDVTFTDADFTPDALRQLSAGKSK